MCVEKINSVWNLEHVVVPFIKERSTGGQMLKCNIAHLVF